MIGLVYFSVPLYKLFCDITGFQGFNNKTISENYNQDSKAALDLNVIFTAQVDDGLDWQFEAPAKMVIHEGVKYDVLFKAKNNTGLETTGTSTFNVLPPKIGPYLFKIECFCFQDQTIQPNEVVEFPVTFYIDPLILDDPEARRVKNVTLSYTFFPKNG
jgi:cytochrome c oxidase assembly protein subunit 11